MYACECDKVNASLVAQTNETHADNEDDDART